MVLTAIIASGGTRPSMINIGRSLADMAPYVMIIRGTHAQVEFLLLILSDSVVMMTSVSIHSIEKTLSYEKYKP